MIKHIVCFKLHDSSETQCKKTKEILLSMGGKIDLIKDIEVGIDFLNSERSYDLILQVVLENTQALEKYQDNEYHCSVVKKHLSEVAKSTITVDYNF